MSFRRGALGTLALLLVPAGAHAQTQPAPSKDAAVILVVDASKSMKADDGSGRPKFAAAKAALNTLVDELPDDAKVGLRVYGSEVSGTGKAAGCADTKLVSPVAPLDRPALKSAIDALQPRGFTPIGASLQGAAKDLGTAKQKTVVLVSDGGDNCAPPAPCGVARDLAKGGVALKIQAVGFQVKESARRQLQCIADAGGGRYVDADNARRAREPAALADGAGAAAVRDGGQGARGRARPGAGQALRRRSVRDRGVAERARVVLVQGRGGAVDLDQRDAAGLRRRHPGDLQDRAAERDRSSSPTATPRRTPTTC